MAACSLDSWQVRGQHNRKELKNAPFPHIAAVPTPTQTRPPCAAQLCESSARGHEEGGTEGRVSNHGNLRRPGAACFSCDAGNSRRQEQRLSKVSSIQPPAPHIKGLSLKPLPQRLSRCPEWQLTDMCLMTFLFICYI